MNKKTYVTTSIPYVNAAPHVGHALELVQADAIARYARLQGNAVRFQTGTDENAFKNVEAARTKGVPVQDLVDANSQVFRKLVTELQISADAFLRTTEARHFRGVDAFWKRVKPEDFYWKRYSGLYCSGCEDFCGVRDLVRGLCPDHGSAPNVVEEDNVFFRLSRYQSQLDALLSSDRIRIIPKTRKNEVLAFVRQGLQDFSVSRPAERSGGWGIRVPGNPSQVIYVWIDALINYLSGLGFGSSDDWREWWNPDTRKIHVIGKNVWKFHAIYWPALLLSADLPLPDEIVVHGFLTVDGKKISKSLGNSIDPLVLINALGTDALRYFFLRTVPPFDDGDFSENRLRAVYNADLANGLGNLVSRVTRLAERARLERYDPSAVSIPAGFSEAFGAFEFDAAVSALWRFIDDANQDIQCVKPWELAPSEAKAPILRWLDGLYAFGICSAVILPTASQQILEALSQRPLRACPPLFPRRK